MVMMADGGGKREEGEKGGGEDEQNKNYISQLPINRPMAALLVVVTK